MTRIVYHWFRGVQLHVIRSKLILYYRNITWCIRNAYFFIFQIWIFDEVRNGRNFGEIGPPYLVRAVRDFVTLCTKQCHCSLKIGNVMLGENGVLWLTFELTQSIGFPKLWYPKYGFNPCAKHFKTTILLFVSHHLFGMYQNYLKKPQKRLVLISSRLPANQKPHYKITVS